MHLCRRCITIDGTAVVAAAEGVRTFVQLSNLEQKKVPWGTVRQRILLALHYSEHERKKIVTSDTFSCC